MSSIGDRLREERERLDLNQTQFAERAGTTRKTQFNYESNARRPDADYLAALAAAGVDVLYVLTGQRVHAPPPALSREETALLDNYRHADDEGREAARRVLSSLAESKRKKA